MVAFSTTTGKSPPLPESRFRTHDSHASGVGKPPTPTPTPTPTLAIEISKRPFRSEPPAHRHRHRFHTRTRPNQNKSLPPFFYSYSYYGRSVRDNNNKSTFSPEEEEQPIPSSMVRSVLGIVFRGNANDGESSSAASRLYLKKSKKPKKDSMLETGVEAALVLGDKRRRKQWTQGVRKQFPWIPTEILSVCTDGLASAFESLAPKDLKRALQPGGLERTRSKIGGEVVRNLQGQSLIQQLPLPKEDKRKLLTNLVDFSLDYFLRDLEPVLATPCSKLRALDRERREIQNYMSFWELAWYRLRYKPGSTACFGLLSLWAAYTIVPFFRSSSNVTMVMKQSNEVLSSAWAILVTCILNGKRALYKYLIIHMRR
eukprot:jgi/Psemu1/7258/gm1.7258_g